MCTLPLPIPLLPLWALQPVQSLSASARMYFTFTCNSTPPLGCTACTEPQSLYNDALFLYLYLYSPSGPYSLYRASVPLQGCTLPLPVTLLPLWAVPPVQSLSPSTTMHFSFTYTSTHPMGCTACTEPQYLYKVPLIFTYISTPPMARKFCTEPQCLYIVALYLYLYLYSLYGPYSMYMASVPLQRCTLPLIIPR